LVLGFVSLQRIQRPTFFFKNDLRRLDPHNGLGLSAVMAQVVEDCRFEFGNTGDHAAPDALPGDPGKEALNEIGPRCARSGRPWLCRRPAAGDRSPGYAPSILLKLYIYGYLNRVQSSRRLEWEAGHNLEVKWLTGRRAPDHKTIADFRKNNGPAIKKVCA
jgi:Transposase domain (DUF772)